MNRCVCGHGGVFMYVSLIIDVGQRSVWILGKRSPKHWAKKSVHSDQKDTLCWMDGISSPYTYAEKSITVQSGWGRDSVQACQVRTAKQCRVVCIITPKHEGASHNHGQKVDSNQWSRMSLWYSVKLYSQSKPPSWAWFLLPQPFTGDTTPSGG